MGVKAVSLLCLAVIGLNGSAVWLADAHVMIWGYKVCWWYFGIFQTILTTLSAVRYYPSIIRRERGCGYKAGHNAGWSEAIDLAREIRDNHH